MLSIIIVSYNARAHLERCLAALQESPAMVPHEIVVVDNASSDGSAEAAQRFAGVRVVAAGANRGFAAANNIGIRASRGECLLLLNSDTVVPAGALDTLVHELERRSDVAVLGPRLVDGEGRPELSFGKMIAPWNELRQKCLVLFNDRGAPWATARVAALTSRERFPDWVSGACLLVWRQDAEAVGLLDERYFMYTEDVDFCAAIRARGRRIFFTPAVAIVHLRGRSRAAAPAATERAYRRSQLAFYQKHHPAFAPLLRGYLRLRGIRLL
jgi:GT2 family glycosyltransferase